MKKLLLIFIYMTLIPVLAHSGTQECITKMTNGLKNGDEYFCFYDSPSSIKCFEADEDICQIHTTICIMDYYYRRRTAKLSSTANLKKHNDTYYTYGNVLFAAGDTCALAYAGGDDRWYGSDYSSPIKIQSCTDTKWEYKGGIKKTQPVMVIDKKPIIDAQTNKPAIYWIQNYGYAKYPNICIGYYCADSNGKYQEPCDDGSCGDCSSTTTSSDSKHPMVDTYLEALGDCDS